MPNILNDIDNFVNCYTRDNTNISRISIALLREGVVTNFYVNDRTTDKPHYFNDRPFEPEMEIPLVSEITKDNSAHRSKLRFPFYKDGQFSGLIYVNSTNYSYLKSKFNSISNDLTALSELLVDNLSSYIHFKELAFKYLKASQEKDIETYNHLLRIKSYTYRLAREYLKSNPKSNINPFLISEYSVYHDIGKLYIPSEVLLFKGIFDIHQRKVMNEHCILGLEIIQQIKNQTSFKNIDTSVLENIIKHHHEKWDGNGYPDKLAGINIPIEARIVSICDVFDALISKRPYKEPWSSEKALAFINSQRGVMFEPEIVDLMLNISDELYSYYLSMID